MVTTIQVSDNLLNELKIRKMSENESYEDVVWDLMEDSLELSEETKKDIDEARAQIKKGKFKTLNQIKEKFNL